MCQHCTEKITTGKQHFAEYIVTPELHDERSAKEMALMRALIGKHWKEAPVAEKGLRVFIIDRLRIAAGLCPLEKTDKLEGSKLANPYHKMAFSECSRKETEKLHKLYSSSPIPLDALFSIRHPLQLEVPYFRQIQLGKGYILVSNTFAAWDAGVIKIYGTPVRLAKVVEKMLEIQIRINGDWEEDAKNKACTCHYTVRDNGHFAKLLAHNGIIKIMENHLFVVSKIGGAKNTEFSFTDRLDDVVRLVHAQLEKNSKG